MVQNRKKLIQLLIGNLSNYVVHAVLAEAIEDDGIMERYRKEGLTSFRLAEGYRERIHPKREVFSGKDVVHIRVCVGQRTRNELRKRICRGYEGIDLGLVEVYVERALVLIGIV
ncbi:hypothetical protein CMO92_02590 [Candidatus Woesearchaeota archaeon]|nr:hypothetical protein [Candidatus Woesearchaeota archaeon]|tara:strand:- start:337 stop:678 length:342 start_codon:yes stop_codon:yes gene_type:complete